MATRLQSLLTRCRHSADVRKLQKAIPELRKHPGRTVEWLYLYFAEDHSKTAWPVAIGDAKEFAAWLREEV